MVMKLVAVVIAALTVVSAEDLVKRQSGIPDFSGFIDNFQQPFKPSEFGGFPSVPNFIGSFPTIPGMGSSGSSGSTGNSQFKRQISPNTVSEWFNQLQENGNNFSGNLPFKPPTFGQFPSFGGSSSGSSGSGNQNS